MSLTIDEITMPATREGPGGELFDVYVGIRNTVEIATLGSDLLTPTAAELLPEYRDNPTRTRRHFIASVGGDVAGRAIVTTRPHTPGAGAFVQVEVLPDRRLGGIGAALLAVAEGAALDQGETTLKAAVQHSVIDGGGRIAPPTGFGDVPADDPGVRFLTKHGYVLEQVVRTSVLDTDGLGDRVDALQVEAQTVAGNEYRLHWWIGATPAEWLDDLAVLRTRMSTDAPMGGLQGPPDPWDAARVVDHDDRILDGSSTRLTSGVEHVPTGRLTGFSEMLVPADRRAADQEDTLVLREHRGHRLGMLLKTATAQALLREAPRVEAVVTWNAEENRPMLDVNEAMGFRPIGYEGGWQKRVPSGKE